MNHEDYSYTHSVLHKGNSNGVGAERSEIEQICIDFSNADI